MTRAVILIQFDFGCNSSLCVCPVTGVIDRLEKFGLVERIKDPADRRKLVVKVIVDQARMGQRASNPAQLQEMAAAFGTLGDASSKLLSSRYNNQELAIIIDFIQTATHTRGVQQREYLSTVGSISLAINSSPKHCTYSSQKRTTQVLFLYFTNQPLHKP